MGNFQEFSRPRYVFGKYGFAEGELHDAQDVAAGDHIYVTDSILGAVSIYDLNGTFIRRIPKTRFDRSESSLMTELRNELNDSLRSNFRVAKPNLLRRTKSCPGYVSVVENVCEPFGITVDAYERILFTDRRNNQIYLSNKDCSSMQLLLSDDLIHFLGLKRLSGIATHMGKIFCVDTEDCRIVILQDDGSYLGTFGREGDQIGEFCFPSYICVDRNLGRLVISDTVNSRVQVLTLDGRHLHTVGWQRGDKGELHQPSGVGVDGHGNIYVADTHLHRILVFNKSGDYLKSFGDYGKEEGLFRNPRGLSVTSEGQVFVVDNVNCRIQVF